MSSTPASNQNGTLLRSRPIMLLLAATLLMCLVLASAFIWIHRTHTRHGEAVEPPANPLDDEATKQQVIDAARQFVEVGRLTSVHGTYLLVSCRGEDDPPYQGTAYIDLAVPTYSAARDYLPDLARVMSTQGWKSGLDPNSHPGGEIMIKNGVTALIYRNPDLPDRGVLQIYGECRNVTDHRMDPTGFVDISDELPG